MGVSWMFLCICFCVIINATNCENTISRTGESGYTANACTYTYAGALALQLDVIDSVTNTCPSNCSVLVNSFSSYDIDSGFITQSSILEFTNTGLRQLKSNLSTMNIPNSASLCLSLNCRGYVAYPNMLCRDFVFAPSSPAQTLCGQQNLKFVSLSEAGATFLIFMEIPIPVAFNSSGTPQWSPIELGTGPGYTSESTLTLVGWTLLYFFFGFGMEKAYISAFNLALLLSTAIIMSSRRTLTKKKSMYLDAMKLLWERANIKLNFDEDFLSAMVTEGWESDPEFEISPAGGRLSPHVDMVPISENLLEDPTHPGWVKIFEKIYNT